MTELCGYYLKMWLLLMWNTKKISTWDFNYMKKSITECRVEIFHVTLFSDMDWCTYVNWNDLDFHVYWSSIFYIECSKGFNKIQLNISHFFMEVLDLKHLNS